MRKLLTLLLCLPLIAMAFANAAFAEEDEVVTIQYYGQSNNRQSTEGFMNDYLEEAIGVRVEIIQSTNEKTQALLASGNLPDVGNYLYNGSLDPAIRGGLLVNLAEHLDQLPNVTQNVPYTIPFSQEYYGDGEGGFYALSVSIGDANPSPSGTIYIQWDVYEEIGRPEIQSFDDLIDVMVQMQAARPETPDGQKTYGLVAFSEWDTQQIYASIFYRAALGYDAHAGGSFMDYCYADQKLYPMLEKGSPYYEALKFLFKCNQAGVLDPDSITQTRSSANAKVQSGAAMVAGYGMSANLYNTGDNLNADAPKGYMPLIADFYHPLCNFQYEAGQSSVVISVSSETDKLDACLRFINLIYDYDACLTLYSGPQGEMWDVVDGEFVFLDKWNEMQNVGEITLESGEVLKNGAFWCAWGLNGANPHPDYAGIRLSIGNSDAVQEASQASKLRDMWTEATGYTSEKDAYEKTSMVTRATGFSRYMPAMDDDTRLIQTAIGEIVAAESWKMIVAADEAEFDALFENMCQQAEELGIDIIYEWGEEAVALAQSRAETYHASIYEMLGE